MPSISTMTYPIPGYVRVEVNWADVTQATNVKVERVDCATGARTPLRPYISYNGDYLTLSCGYGIFWDTEAPLDRCFYYCTTAIDAAGTVVTTAGDLVAYDLFDRTVALGGWGTSTSGHVWTPATPADYSVTPALGGGVLFSAASISRRATLDAFNRLNLGFRGDVRPTVVATGAGPIDLGYLLRSDASTNTAYEFLVRFEAGGTLRLRVNNIVAGVANNIFSTVLPGTYTATSSYTLVGEVNGSLIRVRAFDATTPDPMTWQGSFTDTTVPAAGTVGQAARIQAGNTNVPFTARWDNLSVYDPCLTTQTIEVCSDDLVVQSNGQFRLGDPVRPCNDVVLDLTGEADPDCVPTQGIFFGNMAEETAPANTGNFLPVNAKYPIVVSRLRRSLVSTLSVVSRTFDDRDALRRLNAAGSPLFLRGPAQYGVTDRYMSVGDVVETRPVSDHKVQPRLVTLPHVEVARPSGPTQGVCGTRVDDLCDIYPTWDAMVAAGLSYADLLRGKASLDTPKPASVERTWNDVNATYADWNAELAANTDWTDLLDGDG